MYGIVIVEMRVLLTKMDNGYKLRDLKVIYLSSPASKVHPISYRPTLRVLASPGSRGCSFCLTEPLSSAKSEELIDRLPPLVLQ
jgi:hypothetical protein